MKIDRRTASCNLNMADLRKDRIILRKQVRSAGDISSAVDNSPTFSEYVRNGTCSIFAFVESLGGRHHASVHEHRTAVDWAHEIKYLSDVMYPDAGKISYDLAMSLTKGKHAFIVCTHVDKQHIHSHIVFNSTALNCTRKFRNFWRSSFAIRKISDMLCLENGLSVITEPKPSRGSYGTWLGEDKPPTVRGQLENLIDTALGHGCKDFDSFLTTLKAVGRDSKDGHVLTGKGADGLRRIGESLCYGCQKIQRFI